MREFGYTGEARVMGTVIQAFLAAFGPYVGRGEQVLVRHFGVPKIIGSPDVFYPLPSFMNAMQEFQRQFGREFMRKVGEAIFSNAVFPPGIVDLPGGLGSIDQAYYMNHQTQPGEIGHYAWKIETPGRGTMVCDNPYPCSFDLGIIETIAHQFAPAARVRHADGPCRHQGGDACTYLVEW